MPDMLVKLYSLPELQPALEALSGIGVGIRRALPPDKNKIVAWVRSTFGDEWASECEVALVRKPVSCFIAVHRGELVGFACYDATCKAFFGPMGVLESLRGKGVGRALLLAALHAMEAEGYAYAIVGGAKEAADFYARTVGAVIIEGASPGIYGGLIGR